MVRPTSFVDEDLKIKSLFLIEFRQGVRMAQFWQHFTIQLILEKHEVGSSFYSLRRTGNEEPNVKEIQTK